MLELLQEYEFETFKALNDNIVNDADPHYIDEDMKAQMEYLVQLSKKYEVEQERKNKLYKPDKE